jgi:hypothetical protein
MSVQPHEVNGLYINSKVLIKSFAFGQCVEAVREDLAKEMLGADTDEEALELRREYKALDRLVSKLSGWATRAPSDQPS